MKKNNMDYRGVIGIFVIVVGYVINVKLGFGNICNNNMNWYIILYNN